MFLLLMIIFYKLLVTTLHLFPTSLSIIMEKCSYEQGMVGEDAPLKNNVDLLI